MGSLQLMRVWRLSRRRHAASAFSGEGARRFGARWNRAGVPVVYTSTSLSLAVIEVFVHLDIAIEPDDLVSIMAELPLSEREVERIDISRLPSDWRRTEQPDLPALAEEWIAAQRSLALMVPAATVDGEWNVLLNPAHPAAAGIVVSPAKPFYFDSRMFQRTNSFYPR